MRQNICPVHLVFKLVKIKIDVAANTARLTTIHCQIVEQLNVWLYQLKLAGVQLQYFQYETFPSKLLLASQS